MYEPRQVQEMIENDFGSYLGYTIKTLSTYATPYYYANGLSSMNHFRTVRQLKSWMNRQVKAGKIHARDEVQS